MQLIAHIEAAALLVGTAVVGVVAHELSHALALRLAGVSYTVELLPGREDRGNLSAGIGSPLARVRPTRLPDDLSPWSIRGAALMPFVLSAPLGLVLAGVVPDPFAAGALVPQLALVIWIGCSIPSPQDFSVAWYPRRAMEIASSGPETADASPRPADR